MIELERINCDSECESRKRADIIFSLPETDIYRQRIVEGFDSYDTNYNEQELRDINVQLSIYVAETHSLENMKDVRRSLLKENENLNTTVDIDKSIIHTNDRKIVYEEWAREWLTTIGIALRSIYFLVIALFFYYGPFIKKSEWKTPMGWVIPSLMTLFPFLIYYIALSIRLSYDKLMWFISNKIHRDVYA